MADKHIPMRRCIGCMTSYPKEKLIRIAFDGESLTVDKSGLKDGRGTYICRNSDCINMAVKKRAFNRTFKRNFEQATIERLAEEVAGVIKGGI